MNEQDEILKELRQQRAELVELRREIRDESRALRAMLAGGLRPVAKRERWTPQQVAAEFGIKDVETVRTWCKRGLLATAWKDEFSGQWVIPLAEVELLEKNGGKPINSASLAA